MSKIQSALISFIIPSYNRVNLLERLLNSINKITYDNIEVIIVDDHSSVDYAEIISRYTIMLNLKYIRNANNLYAEKSRKVGFQNSTGEYVVFCDDDDFYADTEYFSYAIKNLNCDKGLSFVSGNACIYNQSTGKIQEWKINLNGKVDGMKYLKDFQIKYEKPLSTFTTVFRRINLMDKKVFFNDSSLYLYALTKGNALLTNFNVGYYCVHDSNISSQVSKEFMLDVLDSKYHIYELIKEFVEWDAIKWWTDQLIISSKYFLNSPAKGKLDVLDWKNIVKSKYTYNKISFSIFCFVQWLKKY